MTPRAGRLGLAMNLAGWMLVLIILITRMMSVGATVLAVLSIIVGGYLWMDQGGAQ